MLPLRSLVWTDENQIVAAGNDCHPIVFQGDENGWKFTSSIDDPSKAHKVEAKENTALDMFRQLDLKGTTDASANSTSLATIRKTPSLVSVHTKLAAARSPEFHLLVTTARLCFTKFRLVFLNRFCFCFSFPYI